MAELPIMYGLDGKASATLAAWFSGEYRPILDVLPYSGYRDNEAVDWLLTPIDEELVSNGYSVLEMINNMTPLSDDQQWLDYLAILLGYVGYGFWDYSWSIETKQKLLAYSLLIWERLGTLWSLETVLTALDLPFVDVWQGIGGFLAAGVNTSSDPLNPSPEWVLGGTVASSQSDPLGTPLGFHQPFIAFVRMSTNLMRWDARWLLTNQVVKYFTPAVCDTRVVYEWFLADLSVADDPVF